MLLKRAANGCDKNMETLGLSRNVSLTDLVSKGRETGVFCDVTTGAAISVQKSCYGGDNNERLSKWRKANHA